MTHKQFERRTVALRRFHYISILAVIVLCVVLYLVSALKTFSAALHAQHLERAITSTEQSASTAPDHRAIQHIHRAIRYDNNHAEYAYALGTYLTQHVIAERPSQDETPRTADADEAEQWLKRAIMLDPANPWPYYELGRLNHYREGETPDATAQYYLAALKNYPKSLFLRRQISQWYAHYDRTATIRLLRELQAGDQAFHAESPAIIREFAKVLYDLQMDMESDQELRKAESPAQQTEVFCQASTMLSSPLYPDIIEFGNDDGSAEWNTPFTAETIRIRKTICLSDTLHEYQSAAIKIFLHRSDYAALQVRISLDGHQLALPAQPLPYMPKWYEIPIEMTHLYGKTLINIYIRSATNSDSESVLYIWGDQDTPTTHSVFGFQQTADLSPDEGKQAGEYMIRLVLRKWSDEVLE